MEMRYGKSVALGAIALFLGLVIAGCGGGQASTPQATVDKLLEAVKSGNAEEAQALFVRPDFYEVFAESIPSGTELRAGEVADAGPGGATVEIYLEQQPDAPPTVLILADTGGGWKILQVMQQ